MNNIYRLITARVVLTLSFLIGGLSLFAQPPGGPPPGGGGAAGGTPPCWEPECVPIDSGLVFLIIAGIALAIRMFYSQLKTA